MHSDDTVPLAGFVRGSGEAGLDKFLHAKTAWSFEGNPGLRWDKVDEAKSCGRVAQSFCSHSSEFPRRCLKLGGMLREWAVDIEKHVAPESVIHGGSQYDLG